MIVLYLTLVFLVCVLVFINIYYAWRLRQTRRGGKFPQKGKATMFDVRHLLMTGKKELAVQVYCEIFNTSVYKAKKDVEALERSLKV